MAGLCVIVVMSIGVIISVCPSSTVLTGFHSAFLTVAAPERVSSRLWSLRRVPALAWVFHGPQSLRGFPPSKSVSPAPCVLSSQSLPMSPQASPTCFLKCPHLALFHKRAHMQYLLCLQGRHLAGRQVNYDVIILHLPAPSSSLGTTANLSTELN